MENGQGRDLGKIANRVGVVEAQLEGIFRQCFQACQQRQFSNFDQNFELFKEAGKLTAELADLVQEHFYLKKQETEALKNEGKELN